MDKLHHALKSMELPMSYISVLSLVGTESDKRARAQVYVYLYASVYAYPVVNIAHDNYILTGADENFA